LVKQEGSFSRLKRKRFKPTSVNVRYRKGSYPIDVSIPTYTRGLKLFYFIELNKTQLFFQKGNSNFISPKVIDLVMSQKIVSELTSNLTGNKIFMSLMTLLFGAVMGVFIGIFIAGYL